MADLELKVGGMACEGCASAVRTAVMSAAPAARVEVDLKEKTVRVSGEAARAAVTAAVAAAGYEILE